VRRKLEANARGPAEFPRTRTAQLQLRRRSGLDLERDLADLDHRLGVRI